MKKCPKCNTILDDSKNKCYMCGADLHSRNPIDFMGGFDDQIGATVTKSQDNVFNNVSVRLRVISESWSIKNKFFAFAFGVFQVKFGAQGIGISFGKQRIYPWRAKRKDFTFVNTESLCINRSNIF